MGNIQCTLIRPAGSWATIIICILQMRFSVRNLEEAREKGVPLGFIQMRRSKDLVHWEFLGWAFPEIPEECGSMGTVSCRRAGGDQIWAPYIIPYKDKYRLYYCVSAFGRKTSYIGLAESTSPEGPWTQKGCIVKTDDSTADECYRSERHSR